MRLLLKLECALESVNAGADKLNVRSESAVWHLQKPLINLVSV